MVRRCEREFDRAADRTVDSEFGQIIGTPRGVFEIVHSAAGFDAFEAAFFE